MSKSKLGIGAELREVLLNDAELKAKVGTNIFPLFAPESTAGDLILYKRSDYESTITEMGVADEGCEMTYNAISDNYDESIDIAERIRAVLQDTTVDDEPIFLKQANEDFVGVGNQVKYVQIMIFGIGQDQKI
jgi:hypothetical protein